MQLWPSSLQGQVLLAIALALLLAQAIGAVLLYRAEHQRIESALLHGAAFRLLNNSTDPQRPVLSRWRHDHRARDWMRVERIFASPLLPDDERRPAAEAELRGILSEQDVAVREVLVLQRSAAVDEPTVRHLTRWGREPNGADPAQRRVMLAAVRPDPRGPWLVTRVMVPESENLLLGPLVLQTLLIYCVLVGTMALILRRITRPLKALTGRVERFGYTRDADGQLAEEGPDDIRRLIAAHNAMEARIAALLDEKDVMLGAIGHDLKTPLTALRVRIESVDDDLQRQRMAATIEDIVRSLDDILSLARVGRPSDPRESTELSALVGSVVEEFEDLDEAVTLTASQRLVLKARPTWVRRALRNLISNALRYGRAARVSLAREGDDAVVRIEDDGPGIPENEIAHMLEPFARGDPSRNKGTGGAGLGLALARAVAEQHGGSLTLANRRDAFGEVRGLTATLRLPV